LIDDKYPLKRSNSQSEFDLPFANPLEGPFNDLGALGTFNQLTPDEILPEVPAMEKSFSVPYPSF